MNGKIITKKKKCTGCGKEFEAKKKGTYGGYTEYCSNECKNKYLFSKGRDGIT